MPLPNACACISACYRWPRLTSHCQMALENIQIETSNRSQHLGKVNLTDKTAHLKEHFTDMNCPVQ